MLTELLRLYVTPAEKADLRQTAASAGLSVSKLLRARVLGRPVVSRTDATTIRELRRLGGLLKTVYLESNGAYSAEAAAVLASLRAAIDRLAAHGGGAP